MNFDGVVDKVVYFPKLYFMGSFFHSFSSAFLKALMEELVTVVSDNLFQGLITRFEKEFKRSLVLARGLSIFQRCNMQ